MLNKHESPSSNAFVSNLVEIGQVVLEKKICKFCQCIFANFSQTWIPFTQECIVQSLVENGLVVQEKKMKMKMWKVYDNANDNNDNDGQRTNFDQKSLLEPLAQVS